MGRASDDDHQGLVGAVLATLLPARRPRYSACKVKCATSRYLNRDDGRPHTATAITAIDITVRTPPLSRGRPRRYSPARPRPPQPPTCRQKITAIITSQTPRDWTPRELATMLSIHPRPLTTQLREWSLLGFFTRTGLGTYRLNTPAPPPSSTTGPHPQLRGIGTRSASPTIDAPTTDTGQAAMSKMAAKKDQARPGQVSSRLR